MNLEEARYRLLQLTRKRKAIRSIEALLWALGIAFVIFGISFMFHTPTIWAGVFSVVGAAGVFAAHGRNSGLFAFDEQALIKLINEHFKNFQESADLLLDSGGSLTSLQQLQQSRILSRFTSEQEQIKFPHNLTRALLIFAVGLILSFLMIFFRPAQSVKNITTTERSPSATEEEVILPPSIKEIRIDVAPPSYTGIKSYVTQNPNVTVPEGSNIRWSVTFSDAVSSPVLRFAGRDSMVMKTTGDKIFSVQQQSSESSIYQFTWKDRSVSTSSDYYRLEVIQDQSPSVSVEGLQQFSELSFNDHTVINVRSSLADDHGLGGAHIIATVSKGSGESVKFREEKMFFSKPERIAGKSLQASRTIDLKKLGMEPGDELYFYVEAFDNKTPLANRARTETYFIALKDTTSQEISMDAGLGVDLMPEYFRSQRQIIIDTEKLLRDKNKITPHDFKKTSNELGYDQKVLRLKYGEFLGEEFESGIGPQSPMSGEAAETIEDAVKQYGHTHDTENEHNLVEDKKGAAKEKTDDHHHAEGKEESPLEAFAHNHDDPEEATFFILSIRAKLKAALTVMWDAELYLRMYEPKKSLPFQYQALRLLKEISNDSRIYVHRTGFDPPPIKEESRLKGDLSETKSTIDRYGKNIPENFPAIRKSLAIIEDMVVTGNRVLSPSSKDLLQRAGNELSGIALKNPGKYLEALSVLQDLVKGKTDDQKIQASLLLVRKAFWNAIPPEQISPNAREQVLHDLDKQFIENLNND